MTFAWKDASEKFRPQAGGFRTVWGHAAACVAVATALLCSPAGAQVPTTASMHVVPRTAFASEPILIQLVLDAVAPAPTGTVTFTDGATVLGTRNVSSGQALISRSLTIGTHIITATYSGDANYQGLSKHKTVTVTAGFRGEAQANTTTAGTQQSPAVAMVRRGYMVVWASDGQDGAGSGIYGQLFGFSTAKLGPEFPINTTIAGDQTAPKIAALSNGTFVVAWQSSAQDGSGSGIYAQHFTGAVTKAGAEFKVNTRIQGDQTQPAIAALADGGFVIAWTTADPHSSGLDIHAQRFASSAAPRRGEFLVNTTTAGDQSAPAVAGLLDGGFVVVWQSADADGPGIYGQRYDAAGEKVGDQFPVNRTKTSDQSLPGVAGLASGGFVVVWQSNLQDGSGLGVYAQRYTVDGKRIGDEFRVNTTTADDQSEPVVASFVDGGFAVVWTSNGQDGSGKGIYAQAFRDNAAKADVEFRVNTTTAGDQREPAVAGCVISEFRAAWVGPDADGTGVFTELFVVPSAQFGLPHSATRSAWVPGSNCVLPQRR